MYDLNAYIEAILLNNPAAVNQNLIQLGVLQGYVNSPEELYQVIYHQVQNYPDDALPFLNQALQVPIDPYGHKGSELLQYNNEIALEYHLRKKGQLNHFPGLRSINLVDLFLSLACVLMIVLIIFIIRKF